MQPRVILVPDRLCETASGDLAYVVGRLMFRPGRPMLVEHLDGLYLEHALSGKALTAGYDSVYDILHIHPAEATVAADRKRRAG